MSQLVKGLSHILSNCYRNNSPEKAVSASQILEYYETKCASVHIFSIKKLVLWNSFKNHLLTFLWRGLRILMYVDLLIIPMVESASSTCGPGSAVSARGQHGKGSWNSQEHFSEIEPKEPLGTVLMITPCENINKGYLLKIPCTSLLTKGFSECLHLTCKLDQMAE